MAVTGIQPFIKVLDNNGQPIVGAKLWVYEVGTTTPRDIFANADLTTPLDNPLEGDHASDANGDFPVFYMDEGEYKLRAETAAGVQIWEHDDLDSGMSAGSGALPIARGGTGATTASAARANLDVPSNSELTALSEQIAAFSGSLQSVLSSPGGRLSLTSLTPVLSTGVSAGTAVYYMPYTSRLCPIYDGVQFNITAFAGTDPTSQLTLTLDSNHVANAIYDCFIINDGGTVRIVTGPAWNTATAGAGARGSGAGTTQLVGLQGVTVNAVAMTARNGANTYPVTEHQATYVGSIFMDGTNGQVSCHTAYGQSRKWGVWNAYNRVPMVLKAGDATATWAYNTNTIRPANNSTANSLTIFSGLPEENYNLELTAYRGGNTDTNESVQGTIGIGFNSTSAFTGKVGQMAFTNSTASAIVINKDLWANYKAPPSLGIQTITALERGGAGTHDGTVVWNGAEDHMVLSAEWRG